MYGREDLTAVNRHWARYEPGKGVPWNLQRIVHLHRRAAFAPTWSEIQRDLKDGPEKSLNRLLLGKARTEGVPPDFPREIETWSGHVSYVLYTFLFSFLRLKA